MNGFCKFLFITFILFVSTPYYSFAEKDDETKHKNIQPDFISHNIHHKHGQTEIEKSFKNKTPQLEYFLQEITNFIDSDSSIYFYDYISPNTPEQSFTSDKFNIYKKMLLLKNIEKSKKERDSIHDIARFRATNYKTQRIPSYVYTNNSHLPEPLYMSQLINDSFKSIYKNDIDALHALVNNYNVLNAKDGSGNSLLHEAIKANRNNMVKFLIIKGANINSSNKNGVTPLMVAAKTGNLEAVEFITKKRYNISKLDLQGMSALDYAKEYNHIKIYFLLKNKLKQHRNRK